MSLYIAIKSTKVMSKLMMSFSYVTVKVVHRYRI